MVWTHGHFQLLNNGSLILVAFNDGYQLVQDPCGPVSAFIQPYNQEELYLSWNIYQDPQTLGYKLQLYQFDGSPLAPQFLVSTTPDMLPTQQLANFSSTSSTQDHVQNQQSLAIGSNAATARVGRVTVGVTFGTLSVVMAALRLL